MSALPDNFQNSDDAHDNLTAVTHPSPTDDSITDTQRMLLSFYSTYWDDIV